MSRIAPVFMVKIGLPLSVLCAAVAVFASDSGATAAPFDECPPPATVTVGPDGNPWHG